MVNYFEALQKAHPDLIISCNGSKLITSVGTNQKFLDFSFHFAGTRTFRSHFEPYCHISSLTDMMDLTGLNAEAIDSLKSYENLLEKKGAMVRVAGVATDRCYVNPNTNMIYCFEHRVHITSFSEEYMRQNVI